MQEDDPAVTATLTPSDIPEKLEPAISVNPPADTSFTMAKSSPVSTYKKVNMENKISDE